MTTTLTATLRTSEGLIVIRLLPDQAPQTVRNFVDLTPGQAVTVDLGGLRVIAGQVTTLTAAPGGITGGRAAGLATGGRPDRTAPGTAGWPRPAAPR